MEAVNHTRYSRRVFALTFAVTFLLMSLAALAVAFLINPMTMQEPEAPAPGYNYLPREEDALTLLAVGTDPTTTETFVLAGFYPEGGTIPVAALPVETAVEVGDKVTTLQAVFREQGARAARDALAATYGLTLDRWATVTLEDFISAVNVVGTVDYQLAAPLRYSSPQLTIALPKGLVQVDGAKAADIIRFPAYENGETQRCGMTASLLAAYANKHLTLAITPDAEAVFRKVLGLVTTDITIGDYLQRTEAAAFLARLGVHPAQPIAVTGRYNGAGNTFVPDEDMVKALRQAFPN